MRRTFSASSFDTNLPLRFEGEVHSIFSKAFNIRTEEDELISIVAAEKLNGPHRILLKLPEDDFISFGIKRGTKTVRTAQEISIDNGNFLISLEKAKRWSSQVEIKKEISAGKIGDAIFYLKIFLAGEKKNRISQELEVRTQKLIKSIEEENSPKISKNVKRLIGFGEGLTPSGDDFLVGLVTSLHFLDNSESQHLLQKIKRIINLEKERTTFLSGKFLEYACQGKFSETILSLMKTIFSEDREEVEEATKRCLDFGATSGRDTILGVFEGLSLNVKEIENDSKEHC